MNSRFGIVAGALLAVVAPAGEVAAQPAAPVQGDEPAKLAEAHAIIAIIYPPATRQQMMDKMLTEFTAPMRQSLPIDGITDPGLKSLFTDYMDQMFAAERPLLMSHLPTMLEAMAAAYAHQFSLAELKDIHAFAETPSGHLYFSRMMAILGDPAVKKVTMEMMAEAQQTAKNSVGGFKDKLIAYLKAHPEAAQQLRALGEAHAPAK